MKGLIIAMQRFHDNTCALLPTYRYLLGFGYLMVTCDLGFKLMGLVGFLFGQPESSATAIAAGGIMTVLGLALTAIAIARLLWSQRNQAH